MKTYQYSLLSLLTVLGIGLTPLISQAVTCACYYAEQNSCQEVYVPSNATSAMCDKACKDQFSTSYKSSEFDGSGAYGEQSFVSTKCDNAQLAAYASVEKTVIPDTKGSEIKFVKPTLSIDIPTVSFSAPVGRGDFIESSNISEYISGVYQYLMAISVVIAIVMVMIGGLQYSVGGINSGQIEKGKTRIKNGMIGLVLLFSTYMIMYLINPELLRGDVIQLENVDMVDLPALHDPGDVMMDGGGEEGAGGGAISGTKLCSSPSDCEQWCLKNPDPNLWPTRNDKTIDPSQTGLIPTVTGLTTSHGKRVRGTPELIAALKLAGEAAVKKDSDYMIYASSGFRPLRDQIELVCSRIRVPNPDPIKQAARIAAIGKAVAYPGGSNHGSGIAIDLYLMEKSEKISTDSFNTREQNDPKWKEGSKILAEIMGEAGFVRYGAEQWHFELESKAGKNCRCKGSACPFPASC